MQQVGYKLVRDSDGAVVQEWGGIYGQCPGVPNTIDLADGARVHCRQVSIELSRIRQLLNILLKAQ